jgi:general secretion pathway protein G
MSARTRKMSGFTLVEILIVVVILGILAAIVIPQFTSASESAKKSSLESQLQTIRSQLELYQVQHNGDYPALADLNNAATPWLPLVTQTNIDGDAVAAGETAYGPYLQQAPMNGFEDSSTCAAAAAAGVGWVYTESTGAIKANMSDDKADELKMSANDVATYAAAAP